MKILFVAHKFWPSVGGTQRLATELAKSLTKKGHQVTVLTSMAGSIQNEQWMNGIRIIRFRKMRFPLQRPWYVTPGMLLEPAWFEVEIVHTYNFITFQSLIGAALGKTAGIPLVMTPSYHRWDGLYEKGIGTMTMRSADRLIAQCEMERGELARLVDERRIVNVPCGVDRDVFLSLPPAENFRTKYGLGSSERVVLYVGAMGGQKSVVQLLRAMQRVFDSVPDARLVLIGRDAESVNSVLALEPGLSNKVRILGSVRDEDLLGAYSAADAFAFPSKHESFGIALVEAAAAGLPIVSTRVGVAPEIVRDGINGYVTGFSEKEFASRLIDVLKSPTIGEDARAQRSEVIRTYDWETVGDSLEQVYVSVCKGN